MATNAEIKKFIDAAVKSHIRKDHEADRRDFAPAPGAVFGGGSSGGAPSIDRGSSHSIGGLDYDSIIQGSYRWAGWAAQYMGGWFTNDVADALNDEVSYKFWLGKGTYEVFVLYAKLGSGGLANLYIDGVDLGQIDFHNVPTQLNQTQQMTDAIISTPGIHDLRVKITGMGSHANDYAFYISKIDLRRVD